MSALPQDIETDRDQIEAALQRISSPHLRYWVSQIIELMADGVEAWERSATSAKAAETPPAAPATKF